MVAGRSSLLTTHWMSRRYFHTPALDFDPVPQCRTRTCTPYPNLNPILESEDPQRSQLASRPNPLIP